VYSQNVACPHGTKATLTRGASKQTSQDAEAEAGTTVAEAVVLLLAETGDRVLSSTSSNSCSYSSPELPVSAFSFNMDVLFYHKSG